MDLYDRKIIGWESYGKNITAELATQAVKNAFETFAIQMLNNIFNYKEQKND